MNKVSRDTDMQGVARKGHAWLGLDFFVDSFPLRRNYSGLEELKEDPHNQESPKMEASSCL